MRGGGANTQKPLHSPGNRAPICGQIATGPGAPVFLNVQAIQQGTGIPGHLGI